MKKILSGVSIFLLVLVGAVSAATIELPQTGQTKCYSSSGVEISCSGTGQDGATQAGVALPVPRFTTDYYGLATVDNLTGLMWPIDTRTPDPYPVVCSPSTHYRTWEEALDHITCLNANDFLGYNDWRLPNRRELRSLISYNSSSNPPALSTGHPFINAENGYQYWSSNSCNVSLISEHFHYAGHDPAGAWILSVWDGLEFCQELFNPCRDKDIPPPECPTPIFAIPVRAGQTNGIADPMYPANIPKTGQTVTFGTRDDGALRSGVAWPNPRFTVTYCDSIGPCPVPAVDCDEDPTNDVVTDNLTGLIWVRIPDNIHRTWVEALAYTNDLSLCGYNNWRLPNINELASMVHNGQGDTAVWLNTTPPFYFMGVESFFHWSSTTDRKVTTDRTSTSKAMAVDLWEGNIENHPKTELYYAWAVRLPGALLTVSKTGGGLGTVTSEPEGINCGSDCSEVFLEGKEVTLAAIPDEGSTFDGWSGACTGTGTCVITINTDTQVTARFSAPSSDCTYSISPVSKNFSVKGTAIPIKIVASGGSSCPEPFTTVSQGSNWISAELTGWQNNSGVVTVTVSPSNSSVQRIATVGIGDATFTATQKAKKCTRPIFTPSSETWPIAGGTGSFAVSFSEKSAPDCLWSAQPDEKTPWVATNSAGAGNGTVDYSVSPNLSGNTRKGKIEVTLVQNPKKQYKFKILQLD